MGNRRLKLYLHLVWGTWDGNPWIIPRIERSVYRCIVNQIKQLGCEVIAINGIADHIHLVVRLKSTVSVALLVKKTKGVSARFINQFLDLEEHCIIRSMSSTKSGACRPLNPKQIVH